MLVGFLDAFAATSTKVLVTSLGSTSDPPPSAEHLDDLLWCVGLYGQRPPSLLSTLVLAHYGFAHYFAVCRQCQAFHQARWNEHTLPAGRIDKAKGLLVALRQFPEHLFAEAVYLWCITISPPNG